MTTRRKAGLLLAAAAAIAVVAFATDGFGAGASGSATAKRPDAIRAHVQFASGQTKAGRAKPPKTLYGAATLSIPGSSPGAETASVTTKCPKRTHVLNGAVGALHPSQARYLTIHGSGIAVAGKAKTPNAWFTDVSNSLIDKTTRQPLAVKAVVSLICQKG